MRPPRTQPFDEDRRRLPRLGFEAGGTAEQFRDSSHDCQIDSASFRGDGQQSFERIAAEDGGAYCPTHGGLGFHLDDDPIINPVDDDFNFTAWCRDQRVTQRQTKGEVRSTEVENANPGTLGLNIDSISRPASPFVADSRCNSITSETRRCVSKRIEAVRVSVSYCRQ